MKGWTSLLKQQEAPPKITNTKEENCLELMKIKLKRAALEWDDFVLREIFNSSMYVYHSLHDGPKKDKLID